MLREQVTHVVSGSAGLSRHKAKDPRGAEQSTQHPTVTEYLLKLASLPKQYTRHLLC